MKTRGLIMNDIVCLKYKVLYRRHNVTHHLTNLDAVAAFRVKADASRTAQFYTRTPIY